MMRAESTEPDPGDTGSDGVKLEGAESVDNRVARAHEHLRRVIGHRGSEDPDDPSTVWAMPIVLHIPKTGVAPRQNLLEDAARACALVCLDPRAGENGTWAQSLRGWYGARIRKVARRARGAKWEAAQDLDGPQALHGVKIGDAIAYTPCPTIDTPPVINRLQIQGTDVPLSTPEAVRPGVPVIYVDAGLGMTVGKAAAQVGHGSMLLAALQSPEWAQRWQAAGCPLQVREVDRQHFAELRARVEAQPDAVLEGSVTYTPELQGRPLSLIVRDAGFSEIPADSATVIAVSAPDEGSCL